MKIQIISPRAWPQVAQAGSLLFRRLAVGRSHAEQVGSPDQWHACGLPTRDTAGCQPALRRHESGMATMIFVILLVIMMILVTAESRALFHLNRETKFLEQQQIKRLNGSTTNVAPARTTEIK